MIIFVLLLAQITYQQCENLAVVLYNSQLQSGLLPTYLFKSAVDTSLIKIMQFNPPIVITSPQGWTLNATYFVAEASLDSQIITGVQQGTTQSGQITVANPTIKVEVGFEFNNGSIKNGQGVAILGDMTNAKYTFAVNVANDAYKFAYVSSSINFSQAQFIDLYANYPYVTGQLKEIMTYLNQNPLIQQGLTNFYTANNYLQNALTSELKKFAIIKGVLSTKTYTYGSKVSGQSFTYTVNITEAQMTYTPYVSYMVESQMNIQKLTTPYYCEIPAVNLVKPQTNVNQEAIGLNLVINSFQYAFNKGYFSTTLNPQNWKVPFFSWSTGGLNNIIPSAYTTLAYASQISGSCQAQSAHYLSYTNTTIQFSMSFNCTVTASKTSTLFSFTVDLDEIDLVIGFGKLEAKSYFEVQSVSEPQITIQQNPIYPITNEQLVNWYIQQGIEKSFVKNKFYEGVFDSQREGVKEDISYTIEYGTILITNTK